MLRVLSAITAAVAVCTAIVATSGSALAAAPTHPELSATEFTQLSAQITDLETALDRKQPRWGAANAACRKAGNATPLLQIQRKYCLVVVEETHAQFKLETDGIKCEANARGATTPTTTTPTPTTPTTTAPATTPSPTTTATTPSTTTTTPITGPVLKDVACLNGDYQALGRITGDFYLADVADHKLVVARGFKGKCFETLADTEAAVRSAESFAFTTKQLAKDAALFTKVYHGKAAISTINPTWIEDDERDYAAAVQKLQQTENGVEKLYLCPHE